MNNQAAQAEGVAAIAAFAIQIKSGEKLSNLKKKTKLTNLKLKSQVNLPRSQMMIWMMATLKDLHSVVLTQ